MQKYMDLMSVLIGLTEVTLAAISPPSPQPPPPVPSCLGASWRKLELPQLAPLKVEEQHRCSEHPLGTKAPRTMAAPSLLLEELFLIMFDLVIIIILQRGRQPQLQVYFNMFILSDVEMF